MSTVDILTKLRTMLPHPSYWREFIGKGLHCYVNHGQANCFINLDSLYDTFEDKFSNELHRLSVTSLIYLSHPVMPKNRQLHLLSMAKDINSQDGTMLDPNQLTFEDFERIIIIYLKAILLDRGILFEDEFFNGIK
jgi:hypothetical protein